MDTIYECSSGRIVCGDNIAVMETIDCNSIDCCISDFPYAIEFMGKNWDSAKHWNTGEGKHGTFEGTGYTGKRRPVFHTNTNDDKVKFYYWCRERAQGLYRVVKPGGCVAIFGHPKTNHRMKCAFEDAGFNIVEEIDWIYLTGFPKSQDIGKLFDKEAGVERETVGIDKSKLRPNRKSMADGGERVLAGGFRSDNGATITEPATDIAKKWNGWKTAGLKPAHEPITLFQKPLDGTYIQNIEKWDVGGFNIDGCRVPFHNNNDYESVKAKRNFTEASEATRHGTNGIYSKRHTNTLEDARFVHVSGRFPPNVILDEMMASELDMQTGGGSRIFPIIKYCPKVSPSERTLPNGTRNTHITVKPVELMMWLIRLLVPKNGTLIDPCAGSFTTIVAAEKLNRSEDYSIKWIGIEMMNTEQEPYCDIGKMRVEAVMNEKDDDQISLFETDGSNDC